MSAVVSLVDRPQPNRFCELYETLDATRSLLRKVSALKQYFQEVDSEERIWALGVLLGRRAPRKMNRREVMELLKAFTGLPEWLLDQSYSTVGDLAETISLLVGSRMRNLEDRTQFIELVRLAEQIFGKKGPDREALLVDLWQRLSSREVYILMKLLTGNLRVGVSAKLVTKAIAQMFGEEESSVARKLMGNWSPQNTTWQSLFEAKIGSSDEHLTLTPYPFFLASPLESVPADLGPIEEWSIEWKWDGIRLQILKDRSDCLLWSRGEEMVNSSFPEIAEALKALPDGTVIDGELLAMGEKDIPAPFQNLQKRLNRKKVSDSQIREVPIAVVAFDLLELERVDLRNRPLVERRKLLADLLERLPEEARTKIRLSKDLGFSSWQQAEERWKESRSMRCEGFLLKRKTSAYQSGRKRGDWFKWKLQPMTLDAVLLYAQPGHGRRASLFTDYTFAVWQNEQLVPIAKAYSGLTDAEINQLDAWIKKNTRERFGPVRSVTPHWVFELGFEGILESPRHKSGYALRFPRILRWRKDKTLKDANSIADVKGLLDAFEGH